MSGTPAGGGPSAAMQQAAEDACSTMQAALAALKDSRDRSAPAPSRQAVQAAAERLRMEVAKMGLLYNQRGTTSAGDGAAPSDGEAAALLRGFQQAVCELCMQYSALAGAGSGPTLRTSLHQTAAAVVEACCALVRGAVVSGARDAQLMMLSGFALEMLAAAGRAPLDDRAAIGRAITLVLKQLADAQKELRETIAGAAEQLEVDGSRTGGGAPAANGHHPPANGTSEDSDSDAGFGFDEEPFSAQQLEVARRASSLIDAVVGLVRALVRLLLAEREGLAPEAVEAWESVLYHVKHLGALCDDLSAAVYPPQDAEELSVAAEALATSCELLADECPQPPGAAAGSQPAAAAGGHGDAPPGTAGSEPPAAAAEGTAAAGAASEGGAGAGEQPAAQHQQRLGGVGALRAAMVEVERAHAALAEQLAGGSEGGS